MKLLSIIVITAQTRFLYTTHMKRIWFKRKLYGWGWTPATWQGWVITLLYIMLLVVFGLTIDENSPVREIVFTFILPVVLLTSTFIRVIYKTGEKPRWQWGKRIEDAEL